MSDVAKYATSRVSRKKSYNVPNRVAIEPDTSPKKVDPPALKVLAVLLNVAMEAVTSLT